MFRCVLACLKEYFGSQLGWRGLFVLAVGIVGGAILGGPAGALAGAGLVVGADVLIGFTACIGFCA